jgi:HAE1 family hydrophobic/amphiphilic exporter-1
VLANGQLFRAPEYGAAVIAYRNGNPVRLEEVARVYGGIEQDKSANFYKGLRNINLSILKQPGTNVVAVVDAVKELNADVSASRCAPSVLLDVRTDRSASIRESVHDVKQTLYLNVRARDHGDLHLPAQHHRHDHFEPDAARDHGRHLRVMYVLNYSLDNLSLMARTLSVRFVVDNTIVMLENIVRHMEMGKTPRQASFDGSKEVAFTIVAMTASLVAIFIPVFFMGGLVGRLLEEFAVTIGVAIIVSGFLSISLTPMLCSRFLKPPHTLRHGALYNLTERMFQHWLNAYDWSLRLSLRHRFLTLVSSLVLVAGSAYLFMIVPKGFLPSEDQDRFNISVEGIQGIGFEEMLRHQMEVADIVAKDPDIIGFSNNVGSGGGGGGGGQLNQGRMGIDLSPSRSGPDQSIGSTPTFVRRSPRLPACASSWSTSRRSISAASRARAASISSRCRTPTRRSCIARRRSSRRRSRRFRRRGRQQRSAPEQPADPGRHRSRPRVVARSHGQTRSRPRSTTPIGTRQISQIYAANNQYP